MVKNSPANGGDIGDTGSIPRSGRSPGEGLNLLVDHQALEVFKKSKAEVQAAWLAGEEWAPGIQRGAVGVDTEERLEGDDALKSDYHPRRGREGWQQARQRIEPGL